MKYDYHIHTSNSFDSQASINDIALQAINIGLIEIAITDHIDFSYPNKEIISPLGLKAGIEIINTARQKYNGKLNILCGMELSLRNDIIKEANNLVNNNELDFIIGSTHDINGIDFSSTTHYTNVPKKQAYARYFENMLTTISQIKTYDVLGHLDYVQRYGKYEDKSLNYEEYKEIIDKILLVLIQNGKGIEINTSGYRYNCGVPHPCKEIVQRYNSLGGEIITIGSDAHVPYHLANNFKEVYDMLNSLGIKYISRFSNRKPQQVKI